MLNERKKYLNNIFVLLFCSSYVFSVFILNISNSQFIVSIQEYADCIRQIKLIIYIMSFIVFCLFYKFDKFTFIDLLLVILYLLSYYYHRMSIVMLVYFIFVRRVKFEYIIKCYIFAVVLGYLFVFFTSLFELYHESRLNLYRLDGVYRYTLGYKFPTYLPNMSIYVYLCWYLLRGVRFNILDMLCIFVLNYTVYYYTDTRAVFYLANLLLFFSFLIKYLNIGYHTFFLGYIARSLTRNIFIILAVLSIYLQIMYEPHNEWMNSLNGILSNRLYLGNKGFIDYGISLLGQKIEYVDVLDFKGEGSIFVIDSGYMKILMDYGLVLFLFMSYGFWVMGKRIVSMNNIHFGVVFVISILENVINCHLFVLDSNPFFLCLAYYGASSVNNLFSIKSHENSLS